MQFFFVDIKLFVLFLFIVCFQIVSVRALYHDEFKIVHIKHLYIFDS